MDRSDLYALPLDEFTPRRNALAKELRRDGDREAAAEVGKLRKPSVPAWAVNQLVREAAKELTALFKAGDALQRAQADLLSGKAEPDALRPALDAERDAVEKLTGRAEKLLPGDGSAVRRQQIADTLHAAALDEEARALVRDGCLERELQHVGLGGFGAGAASGAGPGPKPKSNSKSEAKPKSKSSGEAAAKRKRERDEARAARQAEADARRAADRARRHLEVVQERREGVAEQLREIDGELREAKRGLADAEKALKRFL